MIAIDTNLLGYAHREGFAEHRAARMAIEEAASRSAGCGIPLPCIAEFWTHDRRFKGIPGLPAFDPIDG